MICARGGAHRPVPLAPADTSLWEPILPKYRRKTAFIDAFKITGNVNLDTAPRWLLVAMVEEKIRKPQAGEPGRLRVLGTYASDNEWIVKDGPNVSVMPDTDFMRDYESTGEPDE
jgi:hypothetical protein